MAPFAWSQSNHSSHQTCKERKWDQSCKSLGAAPTDFLKDAGVGVKDMAELPGSRSSGVCSLGQKRLHQHPRV